MSQTNKPARSRGRPPKKSDGLDLLTRELISKTALEMAKEMPLPDISVVLLSQRLNVSAAAVHYHIDGKDGFTSLILNEFYRNLYGKLEKGDMNWRNWIEHCARTFLELSLYYKGVAIYIMTRNRHRIIQKVRPGERDFGKAFFRLLIEKLSFSNIPPERVALYVHLLLQHIVGTAHAMVAHMMPADNAEFIREYFIDNSDELPVQIYEAFARTDGETAFEEGLQLLLDGIENF